MELQAERIIFYDDFEVALKRTLELHSLAIQLNDRIMEISKDNNVSKSLSDISEDREYLIGLLSSEQYLKIYNNDEYLSIKERLNEIENKLNHICSQV